VRNSSLLSASVQMNQPGCTRTVNEERAHHRVTSGSMARCSCRAMARHVKQTAHSHYKSGKAPSHCEQEGGGAHISADEAARGRAVLCKSAVRAPTAPNLQAVLGQTASERLLPLDTACAGVWDEDAAGTPAREEQAAAHLLHALHTKANTCLRSRIQRKGWQRKAIEGASASGILCGRQGPLA
jgi:hypothetical protein